MPDLSLAEYLAEASRGVGGGYAGRATGPLPGNMFGPDFFRKQTYMQISDTFIATYSKKVWDSLNNRTVSFNAIKKVDWGPTVGWRLRTARGSGRSRPVSELGAIPTIANSTYVGIYGYPKTIVSTFGVSLKGQSVSALEGGIGNQFAVEQEAASRDHIKEINNELMSGSAYLCSGGSATTCVIGGAAAAWALASNFHIGDQIGIWHTPATYEETAADGSAIIVSGITASSGTVTFNTCTTGGADGAVIYVIARNGTTSLPDMPYQDGATVGGGLSKVSMYNMNGLAGRRTAGTYSAAALCSYNSGVGRALTLPLLDSAFQAIRQNGGEPKLIITGLDQYDRLNQLLQSQQRFMDVTDYIVGVGDERTYPGTRAGFQLATYRGIPILPDPDCAKSLSTADAVLGSNIYVLDTDYIETAVMYPTQYVENRDYFSAAALVLRGMFVTMLETRCLRPDVQVSINDLTA